MSRFAALDCTDGWPGGTSLPYLHPTFQIGHPHARIRGHGSLLACTVRVTMRWPLPLLFLALVLALGACVAPLLVSRSPLADDVLRLVVRPATATGQVELHIGPSAKNEVWAVASGVNLVLADDRPVFLPFTQAHRENRKLIVHCRSHPDHRVVVVVHRPQKGVLHLQVEDRVQLRSQVRELTLAYLGMRFVVTLVREDFAQAWAGEELLYDEEIDDFHDHVTSDRSGRLLIAEMEPSSDVSPADVTGFVIGIDWKIDGFRRLEEPDS